MHLRQRRWWNGIGVVRWTEVQPINEDSSGTPRCPDCGDYLTPSGKTLPQQAQLQMEV